MDLNDLIRQCEVDLRAGRVGAVSERLRALKLTSVPRELRLPVANLCRRSGLWTIGLRLLSNLLRSERALDTPATDAEKAEYAMLLVKVGSLGEAKSIFREVSCEQVPQIEMFRAFCEIASWNYSSAIDHLKSYLAAGGEGYQLLVAKVNLASALVWMERTEEATSLLDELVADTQRSGSLRLLANCLELRGQAYLQMGDFAACERDLDQACEILRSNATSDQLFLLKWKAICSALRRAAPQSIQEFRAVAVERRHWESVRECDFYTLKIEFDEDLFRRLICGTPYESYRSKVCRALGVASPDGAYLLGEKGGRCFDVQMGHLEQGSIEQGSSLKSGDKVHQMIHALLNDFYKPMSIGAVFNDLFSDEYYNPFSSPTRIHQVVSRTRRFFKEEGIPVEIDTTEAGFLLRITGAFSFRVNFEKSPVAGPGAQLERLRSLMTDQQEFSVEDVSRALGTTKVTARRVLRWGIAHQKLVRFGAGPRTMYRMADELGLVS